MLGDIKETIANGEFKIVIVQDDNGQNHGYGYTVGRSILCARNPHELIMLSIGDTMYGRAINEVAAIYPDGNYPTDVLEISSLSPANDNDHGKLRAKIVEVDRDTAIRKLFPRIGQWLDDVNPPKIYQVVLADKNNKLPDEDGYLVDLEQTLDTFPDMF